MRTIEVSIDVFSEIWKARLDGENSEDQILARLLKCERENTFQKFGTAITDSLNPKVQHPSGFHDKRNGVKFEEGFLIYRLYKGQEYKAKATKGKWQRLDTGQFYDTLNQLNESIVLGNENVWNGNWKFQNGPIHQSIDALRN